MDQNDFINRIEELTKPECYKHDRIFDYESGGSIDLSSIVSISDVCNGEYMIYCWSTNFTLSEFVQDSGIDGVQKREQLYQAWKAFKNGIWMG